MCTVYHLAPVAIAMTDDPHDAPRRFAAWTVTLPGGWTVETIKAGAKAAMGVDVYLARARAPDGEVRHVVAGVTAHECAKAAGIVAAIQAARDRIAARVQRQEESEHE